ncbi:hypothetical protein D3C81_2040820 [compost metagenome]
MRTGCRLDTRHRQQLIDQPAGTVDAGNQVFKRNPAFLVIARLHQVFGMHPEHRQWRAHFVGGVSDEAPLTPHDFLDLREHAIQGCLHRLKLGGQRRQLQGLQ